MIRNTQDRVRELCRVSFPVGRNVCKRDAPICTFLVLVTGNADLTTDLFPWWKNKMEARDRSTICLESYFLNLCKTYDNMT